MSRFSHLGNSLPTYSQYLQHNDPHHCISSMYENNHKRHQKGKTLLNFFKDMLSRHEWKNDGNAKELLDTAFNTLQAKVHEKSKKRKLSGGVKGEFSQLTSVYHNAIRAAQEENRARDAHSAAAKQEALQRAQNEARAKTEAHAKATVKQPTDLINRMLNSAKEPLGIVGSFLDDQSSFRFLRLTKALAKNQSIIKETLKDRNQLIGKLLHKKELNVDALRKGFLGTKGSLESVTSFSISDWRWARSNDVANILASFPRLQTARLRDCPMRDDALQLIPSLPFLTNLNLHHCRNLTDTALQIISESSSIETLDIGRNERYDWTHIILGVPFVVPYTDAGIAHLTKLQNLKSLDLSGLQKITNISLQYVVKISSLQILTIKDCRRFSDEGILHLSQHPNLKEISFFGCERITSVSIHALAKIPTLEKLVIDDSKNSGDEGIQDDSIQDLMQLKNLKEVNMSSCKKLTNACLAHFEKIKSLKILDLNRCNGITSAAVSRTRKNRPDLKILGK